jgi:hypothetical protein
VRSGALTDVPSLILVTEALQETPFATVEIRVTKGNERQGLPRAVSGRIQPRCALHHVSIVSASALSAAPRVSFSFLPSCLRPPGMGAARPWPAARRLRRHPPSLPLPPCPLLQGRRSRAPRCPPRGRTPARVTARLCGRRGARRRGAQREAVGKPHEAAGPGYRVLGPAHAPMAGHIPPQPPPRHETPGTLQTTTPSGPAPSECPACQPRPT